VLPRLERRWNGITSALGLGAIWGVWHLPAFFIPGLPQSAFPLWTFLVSAMSLSVLMAWVVNNAGGSVVVAILMHWTFNRSGVLDAATAPYTVAFFGTAAVVVVWIAGPSLGAERMRAPPSR